MLFNNAITIISRASDKINFEWSYVVCPSKIKMVFTNFGPVFQPKIMCSQRKR